MFAVGLVAVMLCAGGWYARAKPLVLQSPASKAEPPEESLNRTASDPTAKRSDRAAAVFALFKQHIKPGTSPRQMKELLRDNGWIDEAKVYYIAILGGW